MEISAKLRNLKVKSNSIAGASKAEMRKLGYLKFSKNFTKIKI